MFYKIINHFVESPVCQNIILVYYSYLIILDGGKKHVENFEKKNGMSYSSLLICKDVTIADDDDSTPESIYVPCQNDHQLHRKFNISSNYAVHRKFFIPSIDNSLRFFVCVCSRYTFLSLRSLLSIFYSFHAHRSYFFVFLQCAVVYLPTQMTCLIEK